MSQTTVSTHRDHTDQANKLVLIFFVILRYSLFSDIWVPETLCGMSIISQENYFVGVYGSAANLSINFSSSTSGHNSGLAQLILWKTMSAAHFQDANIDVNNYISK